MSNQAENKRSPVAEVDSFLPNGELKDTVPSTEKEPEKSSAEGVNKKAVLEAAPKSHPREEEGGEGLKEAKHYKGQQVHKIRKKGKYGEKSPKEKERRFSAQVTDTGLILEGSPPRSRGNHDGRPTRGLRGAEEPTGEGLRIHGSIQGGGRGE